MHLVVTIYKEGTDVEVLQPEKKSTKLTEKVEMKEYIIFSEQNSFFTYSLKKRKRPKAM